MSDVTPTLEQVLRMFVEERLVDVRVALPCRVESYDRAAQTVNVTPQTMRVIPGSPGDEDIVEAMPVLPNVKVAFGRGGGAFVSFPLVKGDFGHVVFSDASIDIWRKVGAVTHPGDVTPHGFGGAVFYPVSLYPDAQPLVDAHADNVVVGFDGGAQIHIKPDGTVALGAESPADFVALAAKVVDELNALRTAFNDHTHLIPVYTAPVATPAPTPPPTTGAAPVGSVAAAKTKAV